MSDKNNRSYNEQAFLLYYWFLKQKGSLPKLKDSGEFGSTIMGEKLKDTASVHKITGNYTVSNFVTKVMKKKSNKVDIYRNFMDLETRKITALAPYVKLYKVDKEKNIPFYFPVSAEKTDIQSILAPGASTGAVGIQSFSLTFQGQDPFMRDKNIKCDLTIYMDSAESLFRDPPPGFAPIAELITISRNKYIPLKEGLSKEVGSEQVNRASSHEIAADVGYSVDDATGLFTMEERAAIKNTNLFIRMTLTNHSININPDGSAVITASYIGRLSGTLQSTAYNSLFSSPDFLALSQILANDREDLKVTTNARKKRQIQMRLNSRLRQGTSERLRGIFEYLDGDIQTEEDFENSRIRSLEVTDRDIQDYFSFVNQEDPDAVPTADQLVDLVQQDYEPVSLTETLPTSKDLDKEARQLVRQKKTKEMFENGVSVQFVYIGDLVESFLYNTKKNLKDAISYINSDTTISQTRKDKRKKPLEEAIKSLQSFKVLFGEVVIPIAGTSSVSVNLADIPISLSLLQKYFFNRIQQTRALKYTVNDFLEDLTSKIFPMLLNEHTYKDAAAMKISSTIKSMVVSGESTSRLSHTNVEVNIDDLPDFLKRRNSLRRTKDDIDCMVIFADVSSDDSVGLSGDKPFDTENGIYHLSLSKDRGLLKGISFSQLNQKYRKEALMLESVSLYDELKMPYNAQIEMFGNNMFLPGSTIYIDPSSVGFGDPRNKRSAAARLGLGGYYVVTSVSTTYSNGVLSTNLEAVFNSWPDSDKSMVPMAGIWEASGIYDKVIEKYRGKM